MDPRAVKWHVENMTTEMKFEHFGPKIFGQSGHDSNGRGSEGLVAAPRDVAIGHKVDTILAGVQTLDTEDTIDLISLTTNMKFGPFGGPQNPGQMDILPKRVKNPYIIGGHKSFLCPYLGHD